MTDLEVLRLSEPVEKMYLDCTSQLIINLCKHLKGGKKLSTTNWRVKKLSELGALTEESIEIIAANTGGKSEVIRETLNAALDISLADTEKTLTEAAKRGTVSTSVGSFKTSERVQTVLTNLVNQAVDDTNLVNTVMLSSVQQRYRAAIAQIAAYEEAAKEAEQIKRLTSASNLISLGKQMDAAQEVLNTAAGGTALGTTARTQAVRNAVKTLADKGITGFVDRGGHHWTPEAYVNMDVRTTVHNTALQGRKARAEDYDVHTFQVSTKAAARPLCAPYQGKILSWLANDRGTVYDLYGNAYEYTSIYDTSYGEPAGLFGINCGHFPNTFVDGYSIPRYKPLDEEGEKRNAEEYRISQEQRRLERDVRKAKTEALAYDAAGDKEAFEQTAAKVKHATKDYKAFCCSNELTERLDRVQVNGYNRSVSGKATWAVRQYNPQASATIKAVSGARIVDIYGKAANKHAETYYGLVRSMKTDVAHIAKNTGFSEESIRAIKNYIFIEEHDLDGITKDRFAPDFAMAQSWQRLISGKIEPHDITLLNHEAMERQLILSGLTQNEAHVETSKIYNYAKEVNEYYAKLKKY